MKLLILGGSGMAGHMLVKYFKTCSPFNVYFTCRDKKSQEGLYLDVRDLTRVANIIESVSPDVVINCIGILNENARKHELAAYQINGLLPHELEKIIERNYGKLIHISTDCVFSGQRGDYGEEDERDGDSVYARTKALGEVNSDKHLTIRTSIIGPEIRKNGIGLWHWFMQQQGNVQGYKNVIWNGVTTLELAKAVHYAIEHPICGLYHLTAPEKISKLELLYLFKNVFNKDDVSIIPNETIQLDRTLKNTRLDFVYTVPGYEQMIQKLAHWMRWI
jgi:dTDP-4-dehydrorhamnose reductase